MLPIVLLQGGGAWRPTARVDLPAELMEVSGLTDVDERTVACLQDEHATLYFLDVRDGRITGRHAFAGKGDMEGLTRVGDTYFALRSDGLVYRFRLTGGLHNAVDSFRLRLPHGNIEGLAYDERMGRVLVAPKDYAKGDKVDRDRRSVYAFDPVTGSLLSEPALSFSMATLIGQAEAKGMRLPMRITPKGRQVSALKLRMSSIAVDPASDHYFILSAVDRVLLVLDRQGTFVDLMLLNADDLPKPEGITFMPNGDMLISTEGKGTPPRLLRYAARR